ncbi:M48 family metallopeptidase [Cyanobacterium sp. IPPAS B-1200]|uniref:M48 family metallopeptidase n=1 Tax=Cyanobacterium sp. IPPAS B-1200 TaxID=1562720 RepID=UPI00086837FA|nr:M48 family metallopeptidase [Cyanobacterium sp. IPPAS B-1200]OEJ77344.1 peptidase M48 [Cyanobacterium sp. IPPAS B-1200]
MPYSSPISDRTSEPKARQIIILLIIFGSIITFFLYGLFSLANNLVNFIPISVESKIGSLVVPSFEKKSKSNNTEKQLNQLLDNIEQKLSNDSLEKRDYQTIYIAEDTVNAIALPGDKIVIYEGLLKEIESENELVMILSHEIGHFANRDHLRSIGNIILMKMVINYFLGGFEILQSGADLTNLVVNAQYSQTQEKKADIFGINLLYKYYGHVNGATDFFERLEKEEKTPKFTQFLSSHPLPRKRVKNLERLIKENNYPLKDKKLLTIDIS